MMSNVSYATSSPCGLQSQAELQQKLLHEAGHVGALPRRLDGPVIVVPSNVSDGVFRPDPIQDREAGKGCPGPSPPS